MIDQKPPAGGPATSVKDAIKIAFLSLLEAQGYSSINVKQLCERAQVNRSTFYSYFPNKEALADELINEALDASAFDPLQNALLEHQRAPHPGSFFALFHCPELYNRIASHIVDRNLNEAITSIKSEYGLSEEMARIMFVNVVYGNLSVNRILGWTRSDDWIEIQENLLTFTRGGLAALSNNIKSK